MHGGSSRLSRVTRRNTSFRQKHADGGKCSHLGILTERMQDTPHHDTQLVEHVLKKLLKLELQNVGNYVRLSNIYSASHKFDDAENVRLLMSERLLKLRRCNWIKVKVLSASFSWATHVSVIGSYLLQAFQLDKDFEAASYVPTTKYVLFVIEEEDLHFL
ncbi:unnamed protein product [Linum trigynum]|uniref:Pentatricopeptide repeat-containing protein n=1 Tax=Linum trigynum TaxID=586398 RepID=A0AAV2DYP4_9ROSI